MYVLYLHLQIFLWVCSRMIISAHVQVFTCMWRPEIKNRCLHQSLPTFVFETEPLREVGAHLFAGLWAAGTHHPCTPSCGISRAHHHPSSGLHACAAGTLPAEPSPSSSFRYVGFRDGNLTVEPWLTWNSICRPGCPQSQKRSICLSLTSAEIKGEYCY